MKKKIELKEDDKSFERFEDFVRQIVKVPKDEILKREKEEKEKNKARKVRKI